MTTALIFPGQGSQRVGMLQDIANQFPLVIEHFNQASEVLGVDLWQLVAEGPAEQLNQTQFTQPAMLCAGVAMYRVLQQSKQLDISFCAGHSLGEYSALVAAGALEFTNAVTCVAERARLMAEAVPSGVGAMAAIIGMEDNAVAKICDECTAGELELVEPANFNAIGQVVIAGHTKAVQNAIKLAEERGARMAKLIPVSVSCHCSLLKSAAAEFTEVLAATPFSKPSIPVIHNVDVAEHQHPDDIRDILAKQLYSPVRWVETVQFFAEHGVSRLIECGPGRVLTGLTKRISKEIKTYPVYDIETLGAC